jgi:hypothetical protein
MARMTTMLEKGIWSSRKRERLRKREERRRCQCQCHGRNGVPTQHASSPHPPSTGSQHTQANAGSPSKTTSSSYAISALRASDVRVPVAAVPPPPTSATNLELGTETKQEQERC